MFTSLLIGSKPCLISIHKLATELGEFFAVCADRLSNVNQCKQIAFPASSFNVQIFPIELTTC